MPSQIDGDDPELQREGFLLLGPHGPIEGKGMEKNDGETGSVIVVGERDAVDVGLQAGSSRSCS